MSTSKLSPKIENSWKEILMPEFNADYFASLKAFLLEEKAKYEVYPPGKQIFSAFDHTPFGEVRVVIIGQDPYHGKGQAHGLCFSVPPGIRKPPSLVNIFKEINDDLGIPIPEGGNLSKWATQGVLLINATLTVRANTAGSHQNKGWEEFTDAVIRKLSEEKNGLIFLLWGNYAIAKKALIDPVKHHILTSVHPSPFSARNGFFGCKHFSMTNEILQGQGKAEIDWQTE
jgi:uracil-DNA glycosylase